MPRYDRKITCLLLAGTGLIFVNYVISQAMFRDLWFDEALTLLNFAALPSLRAIYYNYVIPNNQILLTILLKWWFSLYQPLVSLDFYLRLLPLLFAFGALLLTGWGWRKRFTSPAAWLTMAALAVSLPFEIYAVALRAYMLSLFLLLLAIHQASRLQKRPSLLNATGYGLIALAAVAALPTNLIPLGAIALWFLPLKHPHRWFRFRWWWLAVAPLLAMALFYLPLTRQVKMILALREGWDSGWASALVFYSAFAIAFLPLLAAILSTLSVRRPPWPKLLKIGLIILLPLPFFLIRLPAPFPRIFFPYWALGLLLTVAGLRYFFAVWRRHRKRLYALLAVTVCLYGAGIHQCRGWLSEQIVAGRNMDDYFLPSYAKNNFKPHNTVKYLGEMTDYNPPPTFISFAADFYPIVFYGQLNGIRPETWLFDNPRTKVQALPPNALVILADYPGELEAFHHKFGPLPLHPLQKVGFHQIYRVGSTEP